MTIAFPSVSFTRHPIDLEADPLNPYKELGGEMGVRALVDRFYDLMDTSTGAAAIRAMHQPDLAEMRERLSLFLCGWLGGPQLHTDRYGPICMRTVHAPFEIDARTGDAWSRCMSDALEDCALGETTRDALRTAFTRTASMLVNAKRPEALKPQARRTGDLGK